ncbi:unnamed protein product [Mytilus edulis]|uniref:Uncharacterized protein n=1 Tax=Mytilus edulis TaxID=6550 RepID=A0A8S3U7C4_MYTED|nr:unnamed protein product [Mytilus edulis]
MWKHRNRCVMKPENKETHGRVVNKCKILIQNNKSTKTTSELDTMTSDHANSDDPNYKVDNSDSEENDSESDCTEKIYPMITDKPALNLDTSCNVSLEDTDRKLKNEEKNLITVIMVMGTSGKEDDTMTSDHANSDDPNYKVDNSDSEENDSESDCTEKIYPMITDKPALNLDTSCNVSLEDTDRKLKNEEKNLITVIMVMGTSGKEDG